MTSFTGWHIVYIVASILLLGIVTYLVVQHEDDDLTIALIISTLAIVLRAGEWIWLHDRVKIVVEDADAERTGATKERFN